MIEKLLIALVGAVVFGALLFVMPILSVLGGAFAGWVVGWLFDETAALILGKAGLGGVAMWQVGAALGFVGSFFRASCSSSK